MSTGMGAFHPLRMHCPSKPKMIHRHLGHVDNRCIRYDFGSAVQWLGNDESGYTAYSYDPSGYETSELLKSVCIFWSLKLCALFRYGFEMHWYDAPEGFKPAGVISPSCFNAYQTNGTCPGAITSSLE